MTRAGRPASGFAGRLRAWTVPATCVLLLAAAALWRPAVFDSWGLTLAIFAAIPAFTIGLMVVTEVRAVRRGMAWRRRRGFQVRVVDGGHHAAVQVVSDGAATMRVPLAEVREVRHAYDGGRGKPPNLEDALVLVTAARTINVPASAVGFEDALATLRSRGLVTDVGVEAFGRD